MDSDRFKRLVFLGMLHLLLAIGYSRTSFRRVRVLCRPTQQLCPALLARWAMVFLTMTPVKGERTEERCIPRGSHCRAIGLAEADRTRVDANETLQICARIDATP